MLLVVDVGLSNASRVCLGARSQSTRLYVRSVSRNFSATTNQIRDAYWGSRIHLLLQRRVELLLVATACTSIGPRCIAVKVLLTALNTTEVASLGAIPMACSSLPTNEACL